MYLHQTPVEGPRSGSVDILPPLPDFEEDERLRSIVSELASLVLHKCGWVFLLIKRRYFVEAIETPHTFEQLKTTSAGRRLKPLIKSLNDTCHHPGIVTALL